MRFDRRKTTVVVAVVLAAALVLSAGLATVLALLGSSSSSTDASNVVSTRTPSPTAPAAGAPADQAPEEALQPFYDQELDWEECGVDGAECAPLRVPVDYADPTGETFELAVLRVPASQRSSGSLVVNPGGPGAPGTTYAAAAQRVFGADLTANLDVVGFDPRGTGDSNPVDCLTDTELDAFLAQDPDPDTAAEGQQFQDSQEAFFEGCVTRSDALVGHVTTVEAARDVDVLRAALDEKRLSYFGASYGTALGATYAELFPGRVGRFVLDGAVDVSLDSRQRSLGQAGGFETALRAYVESCVENVSGCFLGGSVEDGLDRISALVAEIEADPLPTGGDRELTEGLAFYGIVMPLYRRDYWPLLDQALRTALAGDGTSLLLLADLYASREDGTYTSNSQEAFYAISCLDDPAALTADQVPRQVGDFEAVSPTFGSVFAWGLVGCQGIEVESSVAQPEIDAAGADPILVVGTTRDPATPYEWSVALAEQLDPGVLLTREGDGHTGYRSGNACVDAAVEDYLLDGTVPEDGATC